MLAVSLSHSTCDPDLIIYTPTPTLSWDYSTPELISGFHLYWRHQNDISWALLIELPCTWNLDEETLVNTQFCPGLNLPYPVQRPDIMDEEQESMDQFAVSAYVITEDGASQLEGPLTELDTGICMPTVDLYIAALSKGGKNE
jgi:hypothetical protein